MTARQFLLVLPLFVPTAAASEPLAVSSPDGKLQLVFTCDGGGRLTYALRADGRELIKPSPAGLKGLGQPKFAAASRRSADTTWRPRWGKRQIVPDKFNELTLDLKAYQVVARAYDDGVAWRYVPPAGKASGELTEFKFAGDYTAWFYNGEHHNLGPEKLSDSKGRRLPVMTIQVDDACYMAVHEADLASGDPLVLESNQGDTTFRVASQPSSAWRVILFGPHAGRSGRFAFDRAAEPSARSRSHV